MTFFERKIFIVSPPDFSLLISKIRVSEKINNKN